MHQYLPVFKNKHVFTVLKEITRNERTNKLQTWQREQVIHDRSVSYTIYKPHLAKTYLCEQCNSR